MATTKARRCVDTLPPAAAEDEMPYEGFACDSACTVRRYRVGETPVFVLTDGNESTSVTNAAERCFWLAWHQAGEPWPAVFIEHYRGWDRAATHIRAFDQEHCERVTFDGTSGDGPIVTARFYAEPRFGPAGAFRAPKWRRLLMEPLIRCLAGGPEGEALGGPYR
jgi:hypothetical protein